jgi:hypothetical protein
MATELPPARVVVMTVEREGNYLDQTLAGLGPDTPATLMVGSPAVDYLATHRGDPRLRVVVPTEREFDPWRDKGVHHRASWNYWRCVDLGRRDARLLVVEDDVRFALGWTGYLGQVVAEVERVAADYVLSLYSPYPLAGTDGRRFVPVEKRGFYGTQAVLFAGRAAGGFADYLREHGVDRLDRPYDLNLAEYALASGTELFATHPALVQHLGDRTTGLGSFHTSPCFRDDVREPAMTPAPAMTWDQIPGWFDFEALYEKVVREARPGAVLVEVGCWCGRSVAFLGQQAARAAKGLAVYAVEHGRGGATVPAPEGGNVAPQLVANLHRCGLLDHVFPVIAPSRRAAGLFADDSVDLVFIDAEHTYESVRDDLQAWWPKVRSGGLLAGHDYGWPGVARAVEEFFGSARLNTDPCPQCWGVVKRA